MLWGGPRIREMNPSPAHDTAGRNIQVTRQLRAPCGLLRAPRLRQELVIQVCHLSTKGRNSTFDTVEKPVIECWCNYFHI